MPIFSSSTRLALAFGVLALPLPTLARAATGRHPADLAGTWDLTLERAGADQGMAACRIMLRPQMSFRGDYFMGMAMPCRHAMPALAGALRWTTSDGDQIVFDDAAGSPVLRFSASGEAFKASQAEGTYVLKLVTKTEGSLAFDMIDTQAAQGFAAVEPFSQRTKAPSAARDRPSDLAGRYAVLRDKRDTGCMITLDDSARAKGGERAQLAPGCRDQGIVIFDPSAWSLVAGDLVLTARAGHKAVLGKQGEGLWAKDAKDGGKPLGLKKL